MSNTTRRFLMAAAGGKKSTYVDDLFSTFLYAGNESNRSINNGIDMTKGGLTWIKERTNDNWNQLFDTERGVGKRLASNVSNAEMTDATTLSAFNNNGFSIGTNDIINDIGDNYASWTFRKQKGFFDIVTWSGNSTGGRQIAHNLGSVPGCIIIKNTNNTQNWQVYHRGIGAGSAVFLDLNYAKQTGAQFFNNTEPTATHFTLGTDCMNNCSGYDYVAYIFANGGDSGFYVGGGNNSTTAYVKGDGSMTTGSGLSMTTGPFSVSNTAVNFNGSNSPLQQPASWNTGNSNYTLECWFKVGSTAWSQTWSMLFSRWSGNRSIYLGLRSGGYMHYYNSLSSESSNVNVGWSQNTWHHVAIVREGTGSNETHMYLDGVKKHSWTDNTNVTNSTTPLAIGWNNQPVNTENLNGTISNLRITIGQALYTGNFTPATSNLTTTSQGAIASNVKFLGVNGDVMTSSDVDTPDPLSSIFGEGGDQNIIKTGSYTGNHSPYPEVHLGWEPQWLLLKNTNLSTEQWFIFDSIRGIISNGTDYVLEPSRNVQEAGWDLIDLTPTGFKIKTTDDKVNNNGGNYVYMALRRPDGYVGKPPEAGTDVFAMDTGASSSTIPNFDSGFPVDWAMLKKPSIAQNWFTGARLIQEKYLNPNTNAAESGSSGYTFDSNSGWNSGGLDSSYQSWMWKRGAGFDVVAFQGTAANPGPSYAHGLGQTPELKIIKRRNASSTGWIGTGTIVSQAMAGNLTSAKDYYFYLNTSPAAQSSSNYWSGNDTATHFTVRHGNGEGGGSADPYLCLLFASVDGISKCGTYAPSSSYTTVTCGFQPRFVIVKAITKDNTWSVADSLRGMTAGNDPALALNEDWENDKYGGADWIDVSATGFTVNSTSGSGTADANSNGETYIYYAHA